MTQEQDIPEKPIVDQSEASVTSEHKDRNVSFPTVGQNKKSSVAKTLIILGVLLLVAVLGFIIFREALKKSENNQPEPTGNVLSTSMPTSVATPTPTPVDKSKVSIKIFNATGIAGEAGYLQGVLESLGYKDIKVDNAGNQNQTTTKVTFANNLSSEVIDEVTIKLKSVYKKVSVLTSSTGTYDVSVETGLRKGSTPKPSASPTPTPISTSSATPTATP